MKIGKLSVVFLVVFNFCYAQKSEVKHNASDFVIAFGSCNKQDLPQPFWKEILDHHPNLFIWGGDNIYADSDHIDMIGKAYKKQQNNVDYQKLKKKTPIMGTWDDHDYGKNDAGSEWKLKKQSQEQFLNFFEVPKGDSRRKQEGIYNSKIFEIEKGSIKVIILDTRYFRSPLKKSKTEAKRYVPHDNEEGTLLGAAQWKWLEYELANNFSDFVIIVSSIQ